MSLYEQTTIVGIATPPGYGGIGVIRLSGPESLSLTQTLIGPKSNQFTPNRVSFYQLIHPETNDVLDEGLITYFQSPHSFTGEEVVEISCHGSPVILGEVVHLLVSAGATPAGPGEFTLRAFLNQRIDLTQAEAINDLIHSQTKYQAQIAARQLNGELSRQLQSIKNSLIELIVYFESAVEFVEDDLNNLDIERFQGRLSHIISELNQMLASYRYGRLIRSGIKMALIGRPNVGKSSIFNALIGRDRAIVTPIPGTTRDLINETFSLNGIPVELIDTAGIRETDETIEKIGIERTRAAIADADFVIAVVDGQDPLSLDEINLLHEIPFQLVVVNKSDLNCALSEKSITQITNEVPILLVSALTGEGIDLLREQIHTSVTSRNSLSSDSGIITNERHYHALELSLNALIRSQNDLLAGCSEEIVLVNLHETLRCLGIITGETLLGDILNQIFSTFCIGK